MTISFNKEIGKAHVESHTFYEFLQEVQKLTLEGYTLCLENDYFPTQYIGYWSAHFDAAGAKQLTEDECAMGIVPPDEDTLTPFSAEQDAALAELVALSQEEVAEVLDKVAAAVVNEQSADTATDIPVAPAVPDEQPTEKPKQRGRPRLTRDTNTTD